MWMFPRERLMPLVAVVVALMLVEFGIRIGADRLANFDNLILNHQNSSSFAGFTEFNSTLGWLPRAGTGVEKDNTHIRILENGMRDNGNNPIVVPQSKSPILAVGDSFTYGDEVSDTETWPAYLEQDLERSVLNAGVYGYGIDQTVLRVERELPQWSPELVVFSFIPFGIERCEYSVRNRASKPYFDLIDTNLALRNVPVEQVNDKTLARLDIFRHVTGHSYLMDRIMRNVAPAYWLGGDSTKVHEKGSEVSCQLMKRLATVSKFHGASVLVVAQYPKDTLKPKLRAGSEAVLRCAKAEGLMTLDFGPRLAGLALDSPEQFASFYTAHMTAAGNKYTADIIAQTIRSAKLASVP